MIKPVSAHIYFAFMYGERFDGKEIPSVNVDVFVEGLGQINVVTSLSKDLTDRLALEAVAIVRKKLGMAPFEETLD